ncbi:hypothetical protein CEXT_593081 [Caerostris extrusa]|uniref:Uncharacterized protein n=1 Tax=Caerostris extrusa TaxID=172846 RepID=A0AAV4QM73_CAEEX|nr:hypothetical protein CEXT_593081 [Caerostris extrusa]
MSSIPHNLKSISSRPAPSPSSANRETDGGYGLQTKTFSTQCMLAGMSLKCPPHFTCLIRTPTSFNQNSSRGTSKSNFNGEPDGRVASALYHRNNRSVQPASMNTPFMNNDLNRKSTHIIESYITGGWDGVSVDRPPICGVHLY